MNDLVGAREVVIATLNVEDVLGEIVSRLGRIMQAKSRSLALYGREMPSPLAVAQWSDSQLSNGHVASNSSQQHGAVTIHTDPAGNITMAVTTKMMAVTAPVSRSIQPSSGKRSAIRAPKLTPQREQTPSRRPRIPRPALRDLDLILARRAMQNQKITYSEDIQIISQEHCTAWSFRQLEAAHGPVMPVPLQLQEQTIGAVVLYG